MPGGDFSRRKSMVSKLVQRVALAVVPFCILNAKVVAQGVDLPELQRQIQVFSGVLMEGLELDAGTGFLGINSGRATHVYLQDQGVLFEIRTPLATQRNRVSLSALASSIRSISGNTNPFEVLTRQQAASSASQLRVPTQVNELSVQAAADAPAGSPVIDYQASVEAAIRDAFRGVRMLQEFDGISADAVSQLSQELDLLGQQLRENLRQLGQLQEVSPASAAVSSREPDAGLPGNQERIEQLQLALQDLNARARETAIEVNDRYEQAKAEYFQRWQQDIAAFEQSLFGLLCDYGATLRELPADEHVTVVLIGLGADAQEALPADKLHVVAKADLLACQAGELDWRGLQQRATSYAY
jgi:hypothetical protein